MIIAKTPLRVSFTGGGSDMAVFYEQHIGAVISTSIDKYIYITINKKFDDGIRVGYSTNEEVQNITQLRHPIVKNCLEFLDIKGGIEITTIADIPSKGTGLGSSSAFCVGLMNGLSAYLGKFSNREDLAKGACEIEIQIMQEPIGKQDQYAAAYGGLNYYEFHPDGSVIVEPIICKPIIKKQIQANCLFFYTGMTRSASNILAKQQESVANDSKKIEILKQMVRLTQDLRLQLNNNNIRNFGAILHENWLLKKSLNSEISNELIDDSYNIAMKNGASGGKLLGAGAGGFLLFYSEPKNHSRIIESLAHLRHIPMKFTNQGSQIIFYDR